MNYKVGDKVKLKSLKWFKENRDHTVLNSWQLSIVCSALSRKIGLSEKGLHIAALFQDNEHDDIIGWAVCDSNNNIVKQYDDLTVLCKDYENN